jgi:GntR family transcriptional regulator/MocR family aminotransferase
MRQVYAENLDLLMTETEKHWGDRLILQPAQTGLQTVGWLAEGRDDVSVSEAAHGCGVAVLPLSNWAIRWKRRDGLQIGFAALSHPELRRGVKALATLL